MPSLLLDPLLGTPGILNPNPEFPAFRVVELPIELHWPLHLP